MRQSLKAAFIGGLAIAALAVAPATSLAGTVTLSGTTLVFTGAGTDNEDLTVTFSGGNAFVFADSALAVTDGTGIPCTVVNVDDLSCPSAGITGISVLAGDGGDTVSVDASVVIPTLLDGGAGSDDLTGGAGNDTLHGQAGGDWNLSGGEGNDIINGNAGSDDMFGGGGNDTLNAGDDSAANNWEYLDGGPGDDTLNGGTKTGANSSESLYGGDGNDVLNGGDEPAGNGDSLDGGAGTDTLNGGGGDDTLTESHSVAQADAFNGGTGFDTAYYDLWGATKAPVNASLDGVANDGRAGETDAIGADVEALTGGDDSDVLTGNDAANVISGSSGNDTIVGGGATDELYGDSGDDRIEAREATSAGDLVSCGGGADTAVLDHLDLTFVNDMSCETVDRAAAPALPAIVGTAGNDKLVGTTSGESFAAGGGNDVVNARGGSDDLFGGAGNDRLFGEGGHDDVFGGLGNDLLVGGAGNDQLIGGKGKDTFNGGPGKDLINAADGKKDNKIVCGAGKDVALLDRKDKLKKKHGCERVLLA